MAGWTKEEDEVLSKGLARGLSHAVIAMHLPGRNRNMCIGRATRQGFGVVGGERKRRKSTIARKKTARPVPAAPLADPLNPPLPARTKKSLSTLQQDGSVASPDPVSLIDHEDHQCRWPLGDPLHGDFYYCGNARGNHAHYCEGHACLERRSTSAKGEKIKRGYPNKKRPALKLAQVTG